MTEKRLESYVIEFRGDVADLRKDVLGVQQQLRGIERQADTSNRRLMSLGKGIIGVFATGKVLQFGKSVFDADQNLLAMENSLKAATGSIEGAKEGMQFARNEASRLGLDLLAVSKGFSQLSAAAQGTSLAGKDIREVFSAASEAAAVLNLSVDDTRGLMTAFTQVLSKGKVQAEELRGQIGERLPGAYKIAADAMGVTTMELSKMLENGELISEDFLPKFAAQLRKVFGDALPESVSTARKEVTRLGNSFLELKNIIADTFLFSKGVGGVSGALADFVTNIGFLIDSLSDSPQTIIGTEEALKRLRGELRQAEINEGFGGFFAEHLPESMRRSESASESLRKEIVELEKQLEAFYNNEVTPEEAASSIAQRIMDAGIFNPGGDILTSGQVKFFDDINKEARKYIEALKRAEMSARDLSKEEEALLLIQSGKFKLAKEGLKEEILQRARVIDQIEQEKKARKEAAKAEEELWKAIQKANDDGQEAFNRRMDKVREVLEATESPLAKMERQIADVQDLLRRGLIDVETFNARRDQIVEGFNEIDEVTEVTADRMSLFMEEAAKNIQNSLADFIFDPFADGLEGMLQGFANTLQRMAAELAAAELLGMAGSQLTGQSGTLGKIGTGLSFLSQGLSFASGAGVSADLDATVFAEGSGLFAKGGVMTGKGEMPLQRYAGYGIATSPQVAVFGEGTKPEAFIPLPDGRTVPVSMNGSGGPTVNMVVNTPEATSFRLSRSQITSDMRRALSVGR